MLLQICAVLCLYALAGIAAGQGEQVQARRAGDYQGWGWEALVQENGLIQVATVPAIGARIMQYDLGGHASIFVNEDELGKVYEPQADSPWHNYGGYKVWPAPQSRWNWPPPPHLDFGLYRGEIQDGGPDSASVLVSGPVEKWRTPGLRFERRTTIFRGTSRVRVEQTMVNEGSSAQSWSVWDVTQHIVHSPGERDFDHFRVYLPIHPSSRYGASGVRTTRASAAWLGEVAPGIYGVQFRPENKKLFADSDRNWICYVDERNGYAYAKTFPLFEGQPYPDEEARVEVWINQDPLYLEVEVVSPIVEMAANGGRYTFTEDWWAARVNGPILEVTPAGAVARELVWEGGVFRGTFGVFHEGQALLVFTDEGGQVLGEGPSLRATPLETLVVEQSFAPPEGARRAELRLRDGRGRDVGALGQVPLPGSTDVRQGQGALPESYELGQSYPNPFNGQVAIEFSAPEAGRVELVVFNAAGERVRVLKQGRVDVGAHRIGWDGRDEGGRELASGVYFYRLAAPGFEEARRMVLVR